VWHVRVCGAAQKVLDGGVELPSSANMRAASARTTSARNGRVGSAGGQPGAAAVAVRPPAGKDKVKVNVLYASLPVCISLHPLPRAQFQVGIMWMSHPRTSNNQCLVAFLVGGFLHLANHLPYY
jgi:hypothetical protein